MAVERCLVALNHEGSGKKNPLATEVAQRV